MKRVIAVATFTFAFALAAPWPANVRAQGAGERSSLEQAHLARTRLRFAQASWPKGPTHVGLALEPAFEGWSADSLQSTQGRLTRVYRAAGEPNAVEAFVLESFVAEGASGAQEQLVEWLAGMQSPQRVQAAKELGLNVGDVAFTSRPRSEAAPLAWIAFVRGNVAVRARLTGSPGAAQADLRALCRELDRRIVDSPLVEGAGAPPKPVVRTFASPRSHAQAGEVLELVVDVLDPAGGEAHLEWVVGGTGQGYVERSQAGAWRFHSTGPGEVKLTLEVTSSTGTFASAQLALSLSDD